MIEPMRLALIKDYIYTLIFFVVIGTVLGGFASFVYYQYSSVVGRNERLLKECIADGHREYECQGIINGRSR